MKNGIDFENIILNQIVMENQQTNLFDFHGNLKSQ